MSAADIDPLTQLPICSLRTYRLRQLQRRENKDLSNLRLEQLGLAHVGFMHHVSKIAEGKTDSFRVRICRTCSGLPILVELGSYADVESALLVNDVHEILQNRTRQLHLLVPSDIEYAHTLTVRKRGGQHENMLVHIIQERLLKSLSKQVQPSTDSHLSGSAADDDDEDPYQDGVNVDPGRVFEPLGVQTVGLKKLETVENFPSVAMPQLPNELKRIFNTGSSYGEISARTDSDPLTTPPTSTTANDSTTNYRSFHSNKAHKCQNDADVHSRNQHQNECQSPGVYVHKDANRYEIPSVTNGRTNSDGSQYSHTNSMLNGPVAGRQPAALSSSTVTTAQGTTKIQSKSMMPLSRILDQVRNNLCDIHKNFQIGYLVDSQFITLDIVTSLVTMVYAELSRTPDEVSANGDEMAKLRRSRASGFVFRLGRAWLFPRSLVLSLLSSAFPDDAALLSRAIDLLKEILPDDIVSSKTYSRLQMTIFQSTPTIKSAFVRVLELVTFPVHRIDNIENSVAVSELLNLLEPFEQFVRCVYVYLFSQLN
jgi:hypothetical protein